VGWELGQEIEVVERRSAQARVPVPLGEVEIGKLKLENGTTKRGVENVEVKLEN
jgi:hypothetical protein